MPIYRTKEVASVILILLSLSTTRGDDFGSKIDVSGCGHTKGCFRTPSGCAPPNCKFIVTWSNDAEGKWVDMELDADVESLETSTPWAAVAFGNKHKMDDSSTVDCIVSSRGENSVIVQSSFNDGHHNYVLKNSQLGLVKGRSSGSLSDGHLVCKFSRYKSVDKSDPESEDVFDLGDSHQYYIILASGKTSSGTKKQHKKTARSEDKVSTSDYPDLGGSSHNDKSSEESEAKSSSSTRSGEKEQFKPTFDDSHTVSDNDGSKLAQRIKNMDKDGGNSDNTGDATNTDRIRNKEEYMSNSKSDSSSSDTVKPTQASESYADVEDADIDAKQSTQSDESEVTKKAGADDSVDVDESDEMDENFQSIAIVIKESSSATDNSTETSDEDHHDDESSEEEGESHESHEHGHKHSHSHSHGDKPPLLIKIHVIMMTSAWIVAAAVGAVFGLHMRTVSQERCGGREVWFWCHRCLMLFAVGATLVGFSAVVAHEGKLEFDHLHHIVGFIVVIAGGLNPLVAYCRPRTGANVKATMRWIHAAIGLTVRFGSMVAIFLGVQMLEEQMPWHMQWLIMAFLMVTLLVDAVLLLLKREMDSHTGYEYALVGQPEEIKSSRSCCAWMSLVLLVYTVIALGLATYLVACVMK